LWLINDLEKSSQIWPDFLCKTPDFWRVGGKRFGARVFISLNPLIHKDYFLIP